MMEAFGGSGISMARKLFERSTQAREPKHWIDYAMIAATAFAAGAAAYAGYEASRQADISEGTAKRQLRAYLSIQFVQDKTPLNTDMSFDIKNSGQTPAYEVRVMTNYTDDKLPPDALLSGLKYRAGKKSLGSNEIYGIMWDTKIQEGEIDSLIERQARKYIFGVVRYKDIFDEHHQDDFCFSLFIRPPRNWFVVPCATELEKPNFDG